MSNKNKFLKLTLLTSILLFALINFGMIGVKAQGSATVVILDTIGGTTNPAAGTYTYTNGAQVTLTATPVEGNLFSQWIIATEETVTDQSNPITITVTGGVTYAIQAVFQPIQTPPGGVTPDISTAAIVVVLAASGGTTNPPPATYALADATQLILTAIPDNGWEFSSWVISGFPIEGAHGQFPFDPTPTDNPYTVNHGYGNAYSYQPIFTPIGDTGPPDGATPTPTPGPIGGLSTDTVIIISLIVVIIILVIAFGVYAARQKR